MDVSPLARWGQFEKNILSGEEKLLAVPGSCLQAARSNGLAAAIPGRARDRGSGGGSPVRRPRGVDVEKPHFKFVLKSLEIVFKSFHT